MISSWGLNPSTINLKFLREILGDTPVFSAGGWNDTNCWEIIESGDYDALLFGRYFTSNPDLVERLKLGKPFTIYERDRFYGPFEDRERGYTDYPAWGQKETKAKSSDGIATVSAHVAEVEVAT